MTGDGRNCTALPALSTPSSRKHSPMIRLATAIATSVVQNGAAGAGSCATMWRAMW